MANGRMRRILAEKEESQFKKKQILHTLDLVVFTYRWCAVRGHP